MAEIYFLHNSVLQTTDRAGYFKQSLFAFGSLFNERKFILNYGMKTKNTRPIWDSIVLLAINSQYMASDWRKLD